jgi:hypothetical protein
VSSVAELNLSENTKARVSLGSLTRYTIAVAVAAGIYWDVSAKLASVEKDNGRQEALITEIRQDIKTLLSEQRSHK